MLNIFKPVILKPLDKYFKYMFDKKTPTVSNIVKKILGKEIKKELFNPTCEENKATSSLVVKLGVE